MLRRATALKRICDRQRVQNATSCKKIVLGAKKVKFYKMLVDRKRKNKEVFKHEKT